MDYFSKNSMVVFNFCTSFVYQCFLKLKTAWAQFLKDQSHENTHYVCTVNFREIPELIYLQSFHGVGRCLHFGFKFYIKCLPPIRDQKWEARSTFVWTVLGNKYPIWNEKVFPFSTNLLKIYQGTSNTAVLAI